MGSKTGIEWTDSTWNPIRGCSRVSEGCRNCYAESVAARFSKPGQPYAGLASFNGKDARWTGEIRFIEEHLRDPLLWRAPRRIFVNSMSDLFHPRVTIAMLAEIFEVMAKAPQHTYQILTKRPERMLEAIQAAGDPAVAQAFEATYNQIWPPENWWFGVSVEDHETAAHRIPILAKCNCAVRFVSYEPALAPVGWSNIPEIASINWLICGGESGHGARPMHPEWARAAKYICSELGIPFFLKQMGGVRSHNDTPIPEDLLVKEFPC